MATAAQWIEGARPRTLPAALAPVIAGTGAAVGMEAHSVIVAIGCAALALALQVSVNYANDYSDGVRGTDDVRTGPLRLVGSGVASAESVKRAAVTSAAIGAAIGLALVASTGHWWLLAVGAVCLLAAWGYTGGSRPYGYLGLGEVMVFVFFGLVATAGTTYLQASRVDAVAWLAATAIGSLACAVLMANNLRDIPTDGPAGKRTLAVRLGDRGARVSFVALLAVPYVAGGAIAVLGRPGWIVLATLPVAIRLGLQVLGGAAGTDLVPALKITAQLELAVGILLGIALAVPGFAG